MTRFTPQEKAADARREVMHRRHVYARLVKQGRMTEHVADHQIALMCEIADDYDALAREEQPGLFGETDGDG